MKLRHAVLALGLSYAAFSSPAWAKEAMNPQEAASIFFESVYRMDYLQAWQILSTPSKTRLVKLVLETEKQPTLKADGVYQLFEQADRSLTRGFWTQLRQHMAIEHWAKQRFEDPRNAQEAEGRWVHAQPADVWVYVRKEKDTWKFGFAESFLDRRKGQPQTPTDVKGNPQ